MFIWFISLIIWIFGFLIISRIIKIQKMKLENQLMQSYMASMEIFYDGIQNQIEATRRYRHDLANHIQTLEACLVLYSDTEEMREYMDNLKDRYHTLKNQEFLRDELVNSILLIKQEQCQEKGIPLSVDVEDTFYSVLREVDTVALLHNLLDNAIEAQDRLSPEETPGIWFSMKTDDNRIRIYLKNCISKGTPFSFKTKKSQKDQHGIGTKIIQTLVEKYNGTIAFSIDETNGTFEETIMLCRKESISR